jgi:hypothetical protein
MSSEVPSSKVPAVRRFLELLERNLKKAEMDRRVERVRLRARLKRDLDNRKN